MADFIVVFLISVGASVLGNYIICNKEGPACGRIPCCFANGWTEISRQQQPKGISSPYNEQEYPRGLALLWGIRFLRHMELSCSLAFFIVQHALKNANIKISIS